jgi:hypothetical protein
MEGAGLATSSRAVLEDGRRENEEELTHIGIGSGC